MTPHTFKELVSYWAIDAENMDSNQPEKAAYSIVGRLAGSEHFDEWYNGNKKVAEIFDLAADLEMLPDYRSDFKDDEDILKAIAKIKDLIQQLEHETR